MKSSKGNDSLDLDALLQQNLSDQDLKLILDLVAQVSWWVHTNIYQAISVVYPKTRRIKGKEERGQIIDGVRLWKNEPAQHALWLALGVKKDKIKNCHVCHISDCAYRPEELRTRHAEPRIADPRRCCRTQSRHGISQSCWHLLRDGDISLSPITQVTSECPIIR